MNNPRTLLWFALAAILFVNYQAWMKDYPAESSAPTHAAAAPGSPASTAPGLGTAGPQDFGGSAPPSTGSAAAEKATPASTPATAGSEAIEHGTPNAPHIHVR